MYCKWLAAHREPEKQVYSYRPEPEANMNPETPKNNKLAAVAVAAMVGSPCIGLLPTLALIATWRNCS